MARAAIKPVPSAAHSDVRIQAMTFPPAVRGADLWSRRRLASGRQG
jgi:hypothetical protein